VYESILDPNAFVAPRCDGDRRCRAPSMMPFYGASLTAQEMADLVAYVLRGTEVATR
jgi:hypothetical protein